jgi:hypothetical protein
MAILKRDRIPLVLGALAAALISIGAFVASTANAAPGGKAGFASGAALDAAASSEGNLAVKAR